MSFLFLVGCGSKTEFDQKEAFEKLTGKKLFFHNTNIKYPFNILIVDSLLLIEDQTLEFLFQAYSLNTNKLISKLGRKGNGPGEFKFHSMLSKTPNSSSIGINNRGNWTFSYASLEDIAQGSAKAEVSRGPFHTDYSKIIQLNPNLFAGIGLSKERVLLSDSNANILGGGGTYPFESEHIGVQHATLGMAYQGHILSHPSGGKIIVATKYAPNFEIYNVFNKSVELVYKRHLWPAEFKGSDVPNEISANLSSTNRKGYIDVTVSKSYIYLLYSGRSSASHPGESFQGNTIFKYDWTGAKIGAYKVDQDLRLIEIDEHDKMLYAAPAIEADYLLKYEIVTMNDKI